MLLIKYENLSLRTALSQTSRAHLVPENRRSGLHTNKNHKLTIQIFVGLCNLCQDPDVVCVHKADRNACLGEINFANMMKLSRGRTYIHVCNWHVHRLSGHENAHKIYFWTKIMLFKAPPNQHSRRYHDRYWQTSSMHKSNRSLSPVFLFDEPKKSLSSNGTYTGN